MYVDESGDAGLPLNGSPTKYFCLTGLVLHESSWVETTKSLRQFRYWLKSRYGIFLEEELHASEMLRRNPFKSTKLGRKHTRLAVIRHHADQLAKLDKCRFINVYVDKAALSANSTDEVYKRAWYALFQRFENTIRRKNFPGPRDQHDWGIVFPDETDAHRLRGFLDDMRMRNVLSWRTPDGGQYRVDDPVRVLIEDPVCRNSRESYLIQAADCAAYLFKQHLDPSSFMKKHGGNAYFNTRLKDVLCLHASNTSELGVVRLPKW